MPLGRLVRAERWSARSCRRDRCTNRHRNAAGTRIGSAGLGILLHLLQVPSAQLLLQILLRSAAPASSAAECSLSVQICPDASFRAAPVSSNLCRMFVSLRGDTPVSRRRRSQVRGGFRPASALATDAVCPASTRPAPVLQRCAEMSPARENSTAAGKDWGREAPERRM